MPMFSSLPAGSTSFPDPTATDQTLSLSRRAVLGFLAVAPVLTVLPAVAAPDHLVLHRGWVLRATDIERLDLR